jgi:hypothetical protein
VLGEVLEANQADVVLRDEVRRDARNRDLVAHHVHRQQLGDAGALHRDVDERALRPAQLAHRLIGGPPGEVLVAGLGDDVAAAQPLLVRRRAFEHPHHRDVAVE